MKHFFLTSTYFLKRKIPNAHEIKGQLKKFLVKPCTAAIKMARGNDLAASSRVMKEKLLIENARVAALWWLVRQSGQKQHAYLRKPLSPMGRWILPTSMSHCCFAPYFTMNKKTRSK